MTPYNEVDDALRLAAARTALSTLNAPMGDESRVRAVANRLLVVDVEHPDPRGPRYAPIVERVVRVPDKAGNVRLNHEGVPMRVTTFIAEVCNLALERKDVDAQRNIRWSDAPITDAV